MVLLVTGGFSDRGRHILVLKIPAWCLDFGSSSHLTRDDLVNAAFKRNSFLLITIIFDLWTLS